MPSGGKMKPVAVHVDNLKLVCHWSSGEPSSEIENDYSQPSLIAPAIPKNQRKSCQETALKNSRKGDRERLGNWGQQKMS